MIHRAYRQISINFYISKKARSPPGNIPPLNMNCQIIKILLLFPLRLSAPCRRVHFVFRKTFLKKFAIPVGKSAVRPWKAAEKG